MKTKQLIGALVICMLAYTPTNAITKKKVYLKLIEAYSEKTTPDDTPPETGTHFVITWQNDKYPASFFWRGESGWLSCKMQKAHKVKSNSQTATYTTEDIVAADDIHKGDTLMLSPFTGGRFPIPAEIPDKAKNTLYFQSGGNAWIPFKIKKITAQ